MKEPARLEEGSELAQWEVRAERGQGRFGLYTRPNSQRFNCRWWQEDGSEGKTRGQAGS